jgi:hypothetical protein
MVRRLAGLTRLPLFLVIMAIVLDVVAADCFGDDETLRCVGLGPTSSDPDPKVQHVAIDTPLWFPTPEILRQLWPMLKVTHRLFVYVLCK